MKDDFLKRTPNANGKLKQLKNDHATALWGEFSDDTVKGVLIQRDQLSQKSPYAHLPIPGPENGPN